jgi:hypothetical protein
MCTKPQRYYDAIYSGKDYADYSGKDYADYSGKDYAEGQIGRSLYIGTRAE